MQTTPRQQHYYFVHEYLREKCLKAPTAALKDYFHEKATEHFKLAWMAIGALHKEAADEFILPEGVEVVPFKNEKYQGAILAFPLPKRLTESFMAALVAPLDIDVEDVGRSRYFTLEFNPDRPSPHTYIGEWIDESHFNLGDGPIPDADNFKRTILGIMDPSIVDESENDGDAINDLEDQNDITNDFGANFTEKFNAAYFKVDPALVEDPVSDIAIETVANYAIREMVQEALERGNSKLAQRILKAADQVISDLKDVAKKHRNKR